MPISAQLLNELFTCIQLVGRAYHRNDAASAIHHGRETSRRDTESHIPPGPAERR